MSKNDKLFESCLKYFSQDEAIKRQAVEERGDEFIRENADDIRDRLRENLECDPFDEIELYYKKRAMKQFQSDWDWDGSELAALLRNTLFDGTLRLWNLENEDSSEPTAHSIAQDTTYALESFLAKLKSEKWLACIPLGWRYESFPEFVELAKDTKSGKASCCIVNPALSKRGPHRKHEADLCRILVDNGLVNFQPADKNSDSYLAQEQAAVVAEKSKHYIPGRPQLVVRLGEGPGRLHLNS